MRVTVLQQQTKTLMAEAGRAETGTATAKRIDTVKHLIWHGNVAGHWIGWRLAARSEPNPVAAEKLACGMTEFEIDIRNNQAFVPNFGERYRQGRPSLRPLWESTITKW